MKEIWRKVVGFPAYAVSNCGRVKRIVLGARQKKCGVLKSWIGNHGYETVGLFVNGKTHRRLVHRLVCRAFHGKPPTELHQVAHNDGTRTNHHASNLRWATRSENMADSLLHGTQINGARHFTATNPEKIAKGERHGHAVLTNKDVRAIRSKGARRMAGVDLAKLYGVSTATISTVRNGKTWRHL